MTTTARAWAISLALVLGAGCDVSPGADLTVTDLDGKACSPLEARDVRAVVLLFDDPDCPISNAYAPEFHRICADYGPRGVAFHLVYADGTVPLEKIRTHVGEFGYEAPALLDFDHVLVGHVGASVTPEAAVLSPRGELLYRGRIDDRFPDFGKQRAQPTTHDLRDALDAVLAGRTPTPARTETIGCFIPDTDA